MENYGVKMATLMKELRALGNKQAVVMSHDNEVVHYLGRRLEELNFKIADSLVEGGSVTEAVRKFKEKEVQILLMSAETAASGTDLTVSHHLFLFEQFVGQLKDVKDKSRQFASRVHRHGQTEPTFVHRFVTRGSVEEELMALEVKRKNVFSDTPYESHHQKRHEKLIKRPHIYFLFL